MAQQRIYKTKHFHSRREMTALWAVEQAVAQEKDLGAVRRHSNALARAVEALLSVIEEELENDS